MVNKQYMKEKNHREVALEHLSREWDYNEQLDDLRNYMDWFIYDRPTMVTAIRHRDEYGAMLVKMCEEILNKN